MAQKKNVNNKNVHLPVLAEIMALSELLHLSFTATTLNIYVSAHCSPGKRQLWLAEGQEEEKTPAPFKLEM